MDILDGSDRTSIDVLLSTMKSDDEVQSPSKGSDVRDTQARVQVEAVEHFLFFLLL